MQSINRFRSIYLREIHRCAGPISAIQELSALERPVGESVNGSEGERLCRRVIEFVRREGPDRKQAEAAAKRLEGEVASHLARHGTVILPPVPDTRPSPDRPAAGQ